MFSLASEKSEPEYAFELVCNWQSGSPSVRLDIEPLWGSWQDFSCW